MYKRQLLDRVATGLRSLESLGIEIDTYGILLAPIIRKKLPAELNLMLSRELGKNKAKDSISEIKKFLELELDARENAELSDSKSWRDTQKGEGSSKGGKGKFKSTGEALIAGSKGPTCTFCQGSHWSDKCQKVQGSKRRDFINANKLCFSCLKKGHRSLDCKSKRPCFYCKKTGHHQSICNGTDEDQNKDWRKNTPQGESVSKGGGSQKAEISNSTLHAMKYSNKVM